MPKLPSSCLNLWVQNLNIIQISLALKVKDVCMCDKLFFRKMNENRRKCSHTTRARVVFKRQDFKFL